MGQADIDTGIKYPIFKWVANRHAAELGVVHPLERLALFSTGMSFSALDLELATNKTISPENRVLLEQTRKQFKEKEEEILGRPAGYKRNANRTTNGFYFASATFFAILHIYAYLNQDRLQDLPVTKIVNETPHNKVPVIFVSPKILSSVIKKFWAAGFDEGNLPSIK